MTLDGLTLHTCIQELSQKITDAKIQKVVMPSRDEIVLQLYSTNAGNIKLVLNANAGDCAIYTTQTQKQNPKTPPTFCMFLRKHLTGARISKIEQLGLDRVVVLSLATKDELLHPVALKLVIEIMGKYSNIILVNAQNKILDSIKRVSVDLSSMRQVLPGALYENPPQKKYNPLTLSQKTLEEVLFTHQQKQIAAHISAVFDGLSIQTAQEVLHRAGITCELTTDLSAKHIERIASVMHDFLTDATQNPHPCIQLNNDLLPVFFSCVPYKTYPEQSRMSFQTVNEMLEFYYTRRLDIFKLTQQKDALYKTVSKLVQKLDKLINIYQNSINDAQKAVKLQQRANTITANIYRLKKGMSSFEAIDYETGEPITISLDVSLHPQQQAQKLFKKIAKFKTAASLNEKKLADAIEEHDFLERTQHFIQCADSTDDISDIKYTLTRAGYLALPPKSKKEVITESKPLEMLSPSGFTILIGKNDRQNDMLTMRIAAKDDIWFHAQKIPGSHVLLLANGTDLNDIDDETIVFAATLAAAHSRARLSGKTAVDYTQRKNIKKPPSAKPGKVIYDDYFTVYVDANTL
ncbi:MAG: NFACT RNA binding domain-containing protein [Christensenellaceae bacterium]